MQKTLSLYSSSKWKSGSGAACAAEACCAAGGAHGGARGASLDAITARRLACAAALRLRGGRHCVNMTELIGTTTRLSERENDVAVTHT
jgi:hypothetical protein